MAFNSRHSITLDDILEKVSETDIAQYYLGITKFPILINSPLREDSHPSFGLYSYNGVDVLYTDFATKESGSLITLLSKLWGTDYYSTLYRIYNDIPLFSNGKKVSLSINKSRNKEYKLNNSDLKCKVREWRDYDIEYWKSYGIEKKWLVYAEVYPISHIIVIKDTYKYTIPADKYAYAYVERKEGKVSLKIYQPYNKDGYKWSNKHNKSVISLWTKVPDEGDILCVCASLKDALCLWSNTNIPSVSVQGEGYAISNTAINELKRRFKNVFILFDNDRAGITDSAKLSELTGFKNIQLPYYEEYGNPKDISDLYKALPDKKLFKDLMINLFK